MGRDPPSGPVDEDCLLLADVAVLHRANGAGYVERIDVLLKRDDLAFPDRPDMDSLGIHLTAGLMERARISPKGNDAVTAIDQVRHRNTKSVPFADTAGKHTGGNSIRSAIGIVICVGKIFRFVPYNVGTQTSKNAGYVARAECVVKTFDQAHVFRRHVLSPNPSQICKTRVF
jgi:hypothetical protein